MKYVQINSAYNGSTGSIMRKLHGELTEQGVDSYIFWGRNHESVSDHEQCFCSKPEVYFDALQTRLDGRAGFHSKAATRRLLAKLDEIDPDVVHLHNLHGYYVNVKMLFEWLSEHNCRVRWTLHDCWAFTGHCAHFTYVKCAQWKVHCAYEEPCCQLNAYPKTYSKRSCGRNFADKKRLFTSIPEDRMTLITPSHWLADLVGESFLAKYPIEVRHNTIDTSVFKPTPSDFRERHGIGDRFMVLGVASVWSERKGLKDFVRLAGELDAERFSVVVVGLSKKQIREVGSQLIALPRTESAVELAQVYTAADVLFNPSYEENYPTVNLEAEACGTSVVSYDTGGCRETLHRGDSCVVDNYVDALAAMSTLGVR